MTSHNIDNFSTSYIEVSHPTFGAALNVPMSFIPPGSANIFQCFIGSSFNKVVSASLTVGANTTNPQALNVTGESKFLGTTTILGDLIVDGAPSGGPPGSGVPKLQGSTEIRGQNLIVSAVKYEINSAKLSINCASGINIDSSTKISIAGPRVNIDSPLIRLGGRTTVDGIGDLAQSIIRLEVGKKNFDIKHPNKPGYRLRHSCVEGPEAAVYIRGVLNNNNIIELPDYWYGLIDPETITVNLTQIGHSQDLIVEKIEWGKRVIIKSGNGTTINCYYHIWADRLGEKLIVEYQGETPDDYPGDNSEYSIAGWTYDKRDS